LAALSLIALLMWRGSGMPAVGSAFWPYVLTGGSAQILATYAVVLIFAQRNFAVGITFKKTEVILTAIVGFLILGDRVSIWAACAIFVGLVGVLILSDQPTGERNRFFNRAAALGLASGLLFAISAVTYRGATLDVASDAPLMRALVAVVAVTCSQTIGLGLWLHITERDAIARVWAERKAAIWMGVTSILGSLFWFTAFTLQNAAYVFAVGQVEVIFSILAAVFFFRETVTQREYLGIFLLTISIIGLVIWV